MHGSITDDVVVTCDQIVDTPKSPAVSVIINYWFIVVILLAMGCFLILVVIVVKYYMKREFTIPSLLSH